LNLDDFRNARFQRPPFTAGLRTEEVVSDVVLHLPVLEWFASRCNVCCEFGVRDCGSTSALLAAKRHLFSFDIEESPAVSMLKELTPPNWTFTPLDTGDPDRAHLVPPCDLLFVDSLHTYGHVSKELRLHGRKARKFLAFHDTAFYASGLKDLTGPNPEAVGILPAIGEFIAIWGDYSTVFRTERNNGLWVLARNY
jgi:hypothetical protein